MTDGGMPAPDIKLDDLLEGSKWRQEITSSGFPITFTDRLDRLLEVFAARVEPHLRLLQPSRDARLIAQVAAWDEQDLYGLVDVLGQMKRIEVDGLYIHLSAEGIARLEELKRSGASSSEEAFIAMWFDASTKPFEQAAIAAITSAGYRPVVLTQEEYSGFIMDKVIDAIRRARFVIADFTVGPETEIDGRVRGGSRGGVYWEAGMAFGLHRPVIHTCAAIDAARKRMHFDINQFSTLFWERTEAGNLVDDQTKGDFVARLAARIVAVVGRGPRRSGNLAR